jgi:hypothetical protein
VTDELGRVLYVPNAFLFGSPLDVVSYASYDCAFASAQSVWANISIRVDDVNDPPVILSLSGSGNSSNTTLRFAEQEGASLYLNLSSAFHDPDVADETHILVNALPKRGRLYERVNTTTGQESLMYPALLTTCEK